MNAQKEACEMRVIIAGGGIVGLTAAVAFRKAGAEVRVCEQAPEIRAAGASIGLWRNALEVLEALGVAERVDELGTVISTWFFDAAGQGFRAPGSSEEDHRFLLLPRPQLNDLLADAAGREAIRLESRVVGFDEDEDGVTVHLADGASERADLLIGADGVYSRVRDGLLPGYPAQEHPRHHAWRAVLPSRGEPEEGSVLTIGHHRTRGGYTRTYGGMTMWMVNQFDCPPLTGSFKEQALERAAHIADDGWNAALAELIEATPDEAILHNQIMFVPPLPRFSSDRVVLAGDAAHGLSPHIAAGGTLGVEDVGVLARAVAGQPSIALALKAYDTDRLARYERVREFSRAVESSVDAADYANHYAAFSHWMLSERPRPA
jgi:2-polyprenyl-6-methoxyphenol hydroxylase-like FAD-dependent oxidoreductase